jgi:hypothetical protein
MKLAAVRKYAMSLPEVTEEPHFHFSSFRVRGKLLVTVPPEQTHIHVFVGDSEREPALALHREFIEKLCWAGKVRGLRISLDTAAPAVVKSLVRAAWEAKAPKSLLAAARAASSRPSSDSRSPASARRDRSTRGTRRSRSS